ncbi:SAG family member [Eimeria necatrix]|uniref:SAG family member n=1 Tax=Eimeria necatrix TaxID=51315 RepID=U6N4U5_9EIME|nr:SAG family member [Eimeria necatrix]CDJ70314.1 SAG family member [Eimeria necatrix]
MIRLTFIALAVVAVLCGHKAVSASITGTAETVDCLAAMNEARTAAGLAEFKVATEQDQVLPKHAAGKTTITAADLWTEICKKIAGTDTEGTEAKKLKGTFAYYPGENDCTAAVQYWKDGFSLFENKLPPTYTVSDTPAVYTDKAVSFVALYNPKTNPVASCAFVTCTTANEIAAAELSKRHSGPTLRRLADGEKPSTAVICLTNPKALNDEEPPFKEEEWQKIVQAIVGTDEANGFSPVRPSLAVGFIMMLFASSLF